MNWRRKLRSIRWPCVKRLIRIRCAVSSGGSARKKSAGKIVTRRRGKWADQARDRRGAIGMVAVHESRFHCEVRITQDGSVELRSSVQDIGTGIRTVLAQVVAEEFGLKAEEITVRIGDTNYPLAPLRAEASRPNRSRPRRAMPPGRRGRNFSNKSGVS